MNNCLWGILFFIPLAIWGQEVQVTGKVIDKDTDIPLEYATITFIDPTGEKSNQGGVTDFDGNFDIAVEKGKYNVKIEYISFEPKTFNNKNISSDTNLGTIALGLSADNLNEVVVTAETTQVDVRLDKKIYNIGKDLTTQGATVSDALSNVPSVTVDIEGGISLRGNENVRILINGKPSAMAGFGDTNIFQQLPADAIERVEVITSPSARYDAEGSAGILNIILKKEKTLGFNGSISANVGFPINSSISANLNLRTDKFNIFNTIGNYYRKSPGNAYFDNMYAGGSRFDRVIEDREYDRKYQGLNNNFGIEYFINDQSSITGSFFMRFGDDKDVTTNETQQFESMGGTNLTLREQIEREEDESYQASLNYVNRFNDEGHKLTADFQYSYDNENRPTNIEENQYAPTDSLLTRERIYEGETQNEYLIQADYVLPMGEAQFEAGYRGNFEEEVTDYQLETFNPADNTLSLDELSNVFTYQENVNALYSQYGNKLGDFSFLLGLRLEHTQLKGEIDPYFSESAIEDVLNIDFDTTFDKNYLGLFPTVNLIYELTEDENITLGYNRRINRPRGWYINPFPSRSSQTNVFQGNPDLDPAFSNQFDLGYLKKWEELTLTGSVYYQRETGSFERVQFDDPNSSPEDGQQRVISLPINLSTENRYGAEAGAIYNPEDWLRLNASFNFFHSNSEGSFQGIEYGANNTSWFGRFSSKVTLPGKIDWQTNAFYRGPRQNAQTETKGIFSMNLAFSKELIPNTLTASFNVSDVFNSRKRNSYTVTSTGTIIDSEFQWRERQFTLSFIYRFNQPDKQNQRNSDANADGGGFDDGGGF